MNSALIYLRWTLLKRKAVRFVLSLSQPATFICVTVLVALGAGLIYVSDDPAFDRLFISGAITALLATLLVVCIVKGFLQRGTIFGASDIEFLIPAPIAPWELICFRLLPSYLNSLVSGLVFFALAKKRFGQPRWMTVNFVIFEIICAHLAMALSLIGARLSFRAFAQIQRLILAVFLFAGAIVLNAVLPLRFLPTLLADWLGILGRDLPQPAIRIVESALTHPLATTAILCTMLAACWFQIIRSKINLAGDSILHRETGGGMGPAPVKLIHSKSISCGARFRSRWPRFYGVRVLAWKHLISALRTRRELVHAALVTVAYVGVVKIAMDRDLIVFSRAMDTRRVIGEEYSQWTALAFINATIWIGFLGLLLQRTLPFDFCSDGNRIDDLRVLPFSPRSVALVELAVPVLLTLSFQMAAIGFLWLTGMFPTRIIWWSLITFTAMNTALAGMGNIFYLLYSAKVGNSQSGEVLGAFLLVALSLSAVIPAIGTYIRLARFAPGTPAMLGGLGVQCVIDVFAILTLAKVYQRCELSRELQ